MFVSILSSAMGITILFLIALILVVLLQPSWVVRTLLRHLVPGVIFCGDGRRKELALTIDDSPSKPIHGLSAGASSRNLLEVLRRLDIPATFFVISGHINEADPDFIQLALSDGHRIGHHMTEDHVSARLSSLDFRQSFDRAAEDLHRAAEPHALSLRWFRPGGGWIRSSMLQTVAEKGYRLVLGSVFPWDTFHPPLALMRWFVLRNVHPGAILIIHDRTDTVQASMELLYHVVPLLRQRGYRFVDLDRLLNV